MGKAVTLAAIPAWAGILPGNPLTIASSDGNINLISLVVINQKTKKLHEAFINAG
jgi:hypothetical protein